MYSLLIWLSEASTVPALQVGQLGGVRRRPLNLVFGEPTQSFP
jgi:hypothetical protein